VVFVWFPAAFVYGRLSAMKKRRVIMVVVGCLVLAAAAALLGLREREPRYNGRTLSEWLARYNPAWDRDDGGRTTSENAAEAVKHIGTNALPWLVRWIRYEPRPWEVKLHFLTRKLPQVIRPSLWEGA